MSGASAAWLASRVIPGSLGVASASLVPVVRWERPPPGTLRRGAIALYSAPPWYVAVALVAAVALLAFAVRRRARRR